MVFESHLSNKELESLGDIIYFFIYNGRVVKVGQSVNFRIRKTTYCGTSCQTTKMIIRESNKLSIDEVEVYAVKIPRVSTTITSLITSNKHEVKISKLREFEKVYVAEAKAMGENLIFNTH